ncbi:hypothetical protein ZIOFF_034632 [Zingiber officinale]|uniref:LOB domain-containing protein n=1 Tax=Zingiber officinale TaxID=94328 RepID=A0A8J5LD30_ZINOF|nr:hypothetical protein ZIOFF_034632 [Zingiber officinale]
MGQQKTQTAGCAACNHMHHRCLPNCIFAPYFPATSPSFGYISQVYSCNNIKKILQSAPVEKRTRKAESLAFEAEARIRNPEFGCVGYIHLLQQHWAQIERDIQEINEAQFSAASYQPPVEQQYWHQMPQLTTMTAQSYHEQPDDFPIPQMTQTMSEMSPLQQHGQLAEIEDFLNETRSDDTMTDAAVQDYEADLKDLLRVIPSTQDDGTTGAEVEEFAADLQEDLLSSYQPPLEQQYWHQMTMTAQPYHDQPDFQTQSYHEQSDDFPTQSYHEQPDDFPIPQMTQTMSEMRPLQQHDQLAEIEDFLSEICSDDLMTDAALQAYEADLKDLLRVIPSTQDDGVTNAEVEEFAADLEEDLLRVIPSTQDDGMIDAEVEEFAADLEEYFLNS